ncbi:unnamed protein product [Spirodela intermedia]|uniref:Uncharacterized protein n=1 Tax=Spirodela intermedia TaxID=51605 RepID=A0A7I8JDR1_SPIIN|nr:unnamed protein product [Spirodela intermedia]CAA6667663.1 unnamed protein product [Spirodela intermedia]
MHAKTDSEVTSLAASSPARSPAARFTSCRPRRFPPHSHSSTSRFSRKISPTDAAAAGGRRRCEEATAWKNCSVIEEEGLLEDEDGERGLPRRCRYILAFLLGFFVLFSSFSLILWAPAVPASHRSIRERWQRVPTDMVSMNSTVKLSFRNTAAFFGLHVSSTPVELFYSQLALATGNIDSFYQSRKSQRTLTVVVRGERIPLYGSIPASGGDGGHNPPPVPVTLSFTVKSRAYVLGKLVKPKFSVPVRCLVALDRTKLNAAVALKNFCHYG